MEVLYESKYFNRFVNAGRFLCEIMSGTAPAIANGINTSGRLQVNPAELVSTKFTSP